MVEDELNLSDIRLDDLFNQAHDGVVGCDAGERRQTISRDNPLGSLMAGLQQFTFLADTNHGVSAMPKAILDAIPSMANAGVKHLMLEYHIYPAGHPQRDTSGEQTEAIMQTFFVNQSRISDDEVRKSAHLFRTATPGVSEEENKKIGDYYAEILIEARKHGIKVHLAGDGIGHDESVEMDKLIEERHRYLQENKQFHDEYQRWLTDDKYIESLDLSPDQEDLFLKELVRHGKKIENYFDTLIELNRRHEEVRMSPEAEQKRAERFTNLAQGEKAVVMFGSDHFDNENDINERVDQILRAKALKEGTAFHPSRVAELWESRLEYEQTKNQKATRQADIRYYLDTQDVELGVDSVESLVICENKVQASPSSGLKR